MNIDWVQRATAANLEVRDFIDGLPRSASNRSHLEKYSPRDGRLLYRLEESSGKEVDQAVQSAQRAIDDARWSGATPQRRKEVLQNLARLIERNGDELALLECLDVGKPIKESAGADVPAAVAIIRNSAEALDKLASRVYGANGSGLAYQLRRPWGVVAAMIGWNFPLLLAAGKIGPALATGNSLVLKPSDVASLSACRVAQLAIEAGLPEGVLNVVHGGPSVGSALARHPDVDMVTFTGSTHTGKRLLVAAGESNMKRLLLECGGKSPTIVFEDSPDLEAVADSVVARAFYNQGQVCTASSRLMIQSGIKDKLLALVIEKAANWIPGDPLSIATTLGALVSRNHMLKVQAYIDGADAQGTRKIFQGASSRPFPHGFYTSPVIFCDVEPRQALAQEEIFGPVLSVFSFGSEEDAVRLANDTIYGLSAAIWTPDLGRAHRMAHKLKAGYTVINATDKPAEEFDAALSAGGLKQSGIGVEGGMDGLAAYTSATTVQMLV